MALQKTLVPTLLGGVSQQSHAIRPRNLVDSAVNVEFLANEGTIKRYPTEHIADLDMDLSGYRVVPLERDDAEYLCLFGPSDVRVFDATDGSEATVTAPGGFGYLSGLTQRNFRAQRIADSLWVLNRGTTVAGAAGRDFPSWEEPGEAGLFIRAVNYSTTYTLTYEDDGPNAATVEYLVPGPISVPTDNFSVVVTTAQVTGPVASRDPIVWTGFPYNSLEDLQIEESAVVLPQGDFEVYREGAPDFEYGIKYTGSSLSNGDTLDIERGATTLDYFLDTSYVLDALLYYLTEAVGDVEVERNAEDSSVRVFNQTDTITRFELDDSDSGDLGTAWIRTVDEITDLPLVFKHGAVVEVAGDRSDRRDDYWLTFAGDTWANAGSDPDTFDTFDDFESGVWIETQERGLPTGAYDDSTMPHVLQRTGPTTFTWGPAEWIERPVGDEVTNPEPGFIGLTIEDIFFHETRLGFLAGNTLSLSESGALENFWRSTVRAVVPTDPVGAELSEADGDTLFHAVPFDGSLLVFSRQRQVLVFGEPALAPDTIQAPLLTSYRCFPSVEPALQGQSMFFGYSTSDYAQLREFIPSAENRRVNDETITLAAPKYVPADVRRIVAGSVGETLAVLADSEPQRVYVYSFLRLGGNLAQAAWSSWDMEAAIVDIAFLDDRLVLLLDRGGSTFLEEIRLGAGRTETDEEFIPRIDRQTGGLFGTYDIGTDATTFTAPYEPSEDAKVLNGQSGSGEYGAELPVRSVTGTTVVLDGDHSAQELILGEPYTASLELSRPLLQADRGPAGSSAIPEARQSIRKLTLILDDTGYLNAEVQYVASESSSVEFLGDLLGARAFEQGVLRSGELSIPIHAGVRDFNVVLSSDSALPFNIVSGAWSIRYNTVFSVA